MLRYLLFYVVCAMLTSGCATPPANEAPPMQSEDRDQIQAALKASADSWNQGNLAGHLAIYDESVTTMTRNGPRPTIAAIESSFRTTYFVGDKPKQNLRMESVTIRALSKDSALMTGRFTLSGGELPDQSGWFTLIWLRTPTGWKVVHDHTS